MVGDTTWDCEAAKRAGVETDRACSPEASPSRSCCDAGAACVFRSIAELRERLGDTPLAAEGGREAVVSAQAHVHRRGSAARMGYN